jgi:hypothetical protein
MNTPRYGLPFLSVAQAHKEITHNESLATIDALLHMSVAETATAPPAPTVGDAGKCWLIASGATGAWQGHDRSIACWNGSGWNLIAPMTGMTIWHEQAQVEMRFLAGQWQQPGTVDVPQGGAITDAEARAAIALLLTRLRALGILAA